MKIENGRELVEELAKQAVASGYARSGIFIIVDEKGSVHKTEFGFDGDKKTDIVDYPEASSVNN